MQNNNNDSITLYGCNFFLSYKNYTEMSMEQDNQINNFFWLQLEKYGKLGMN
jgi:hypothetical protein